MMEKRAEATMGAPLVADWIAEGYDPVTEETPDIDLEIKRLRTLKSYFLLDSKPQDCYERITDLMRDCFSMPKVCITLIDIGRVFMLSSKGFDTTKSREVPRKTSFCAHAIIQRSGILIVPNAIEDPRWRDNEYVKGDFGLRFFAGCPITAPNGCKIGTLSLVDTKPRDFSMAEQKILHSIASTVMHLMESNKRAIIKNKLTDVYTSAKSVESKLSRLNQDEQLQMILSRSQAHDLRSAKEDSSFVCREFQKQIEQLSQQTITQETFPKRIKIHEKGGRVAPKVVALGEIRSVKISSFIHSLQVVSPNVPSNTQMSIVVDGSVPERAVFNDLIVFRSSHAMLSRAAKTGHPKSIFFRISKKEDGLTNRLLFECEETCAEGAEEKVDDSSRSKNAFCSCEPPEEEKDDSFPIPVVEQYIGSIEGGLFGVFRKERGTVVWFSIPLVQFGFS